MRFVMLASWLVMPVPAQEPRAVVTGPISEATAMKAWFGNYDTKTKTSRVDDRLASVLNTQVGTIGGQPVWILYTVLRQENNDCHGCTASLAAAQFVKRGNGWQLQHTGQVDELGSFGTVSAKEAVAWGREAYGLVIYHGWTGQGQVIMAEQLFGFDGGSFRRIAALSLGQDNSGAVPDPQDAFAWQASWKFGAPNAAGIFDIQITLDPKNRYAAGPDGRKEVPLPGVYRYDGRQYRHVSAKGVTLQ
jgi:hypothetical protein